MEWDPAKICGRSNLIENFVCRQSSLFSFCEEWQRQFLLPRIKHCRKMSFQLPPNDFTPAELKESNKKPIYAAVAVGFVLATGAVILRLIARRISKANKFGWDDYTIIFALVNSFSPPSSLFQSRLDIIQFLLYALDITTVISAAKYGLGQHLPVVIPTVVQFQKVRVHQWSFTAKSS